MIAADKKSIELALEREHRTSQRQALLKQLWRLDQLASEDESANVAKGLGRGAESRTDSDL